MRAVFASLLVRIRGGAPLRKDSFTIPMSFTNIMRRVKGELMPLQATLVSPSAWC